MESVKVPVLMVASMCLFNSPGVYVKNLSKFYHEQQCSHFNGTISDHQEAANIGKYICNPPPVKSNNKKWGYIG
jgi:hypothetical protein